MDLLLLRVWVSPQKRSEAGTVASWILPWKLSVAWQPVLGRDVTYHNAASQENRWPGRHSITMPSTPEPARWSSGSSGGIGVHFGVYPSLQGRNFPIKRSVRRKCGSVSGERIALVAWFEPAMARVATLPVLLRSILDGK